MLYTSENRRFTRRKITEALKKFEGKQINFDTCIPAIVEEIVKSLDGRAQSYFTPKGNNLLNFNGIDDG